MIWVGGEMCLPFQKPFFLSPSPNLTKVNKVFSPPPPRDQSRRVYFILRQHHTRNLFVYPRKAGQTDLMIFTLDCRTDRQTKFPCFPGLVGLQLISWAHWRRLGELEALIWKKKFKSKRPPPPHTATVKPPPPHTISRCYVGGNPTDRPSG